MPAQLDIVAVAELADGFKGDHHGKRQLRESVGPIWQSERPSSTHCTLTAVVDAVDGDSDRAIVTSHLIVLGNDSPVSIASLSFITQQLVRIESQWLIERRSIRSG